MSSCDPAVLSSLGSAATGQFGSLGVSWNAPPPPRPSHYEVPGEQPATVQNPRQLERKQTPDDDLGRSCSFTSPPVDPSSSPPPPSGFDPWDVSTRGLAALLETEQKPPRSQPSPSPSPVVNGVELGGGRSGLSSAVTLDSSTNLSWQDELKTVFPNVNISFGGLAALSLSPSLSLSLSLLLPLSCPADSVNFSLRIDLMFDSIHKQVCQTLTI